MDVVSKRDMRFNGVLSILLPLKSPYASSNPSSLRHGADCDLSCSLNTTMYVGSATIHGSEDDTSVGFILHLSYMDILSYHLSASSLRVESLHL